MYIDTHTECMYVGNYKVGDKYVHSCTPEY